MMKDFTELTMEQLHNIETGTLTTTLNALTKVAGLISTGVMIAASVAGLTKSTHSDAGEIKTKDATYKWKESREEYRTPVYFTY